MWTTFRRACRQTVVSSYIYRSLFKGTTDWRHTSDPEMKAKKTFVARRRRRVILFIALCLAVIAAMFVLDCAIFNVHISPYSVRQRASLYPATFNISGRCSWYRKPTNREFKPHSFLVMAQALTDIYNLYDIKFVLREGSLLHVYRHLPADDDMDMWMIVPKHMTHLYAYTKIREVLRSKKEYENITFDYQNLFLVSLFMEYSDSVRISYEGIKLIDLSVLHETFLNDPATQMPCLEQMQCELTDNRPEFLKYGHLVMTKRLFENLCKCPFMDTEFLCFTSVPEYLKLRYGDNVMTPTARKDFVRPRHLLFERPFKIYRKLLTLVPGLFDLRLYFEGHDIDKEAAKRAELVPFDKFMKSRELELHKKQ